MFELQLHQGTVRTLVYGPKNYGKLEASGSFDKASGKFTLIRVNIEDSLRSLVEDKPTT